MADTWNDGGTTFTAIKMNVTNTASAAGSRLIDLQIAASSLFFVDKDGNSTLSGEFSSSVLKAADRLEADRVLFTTTGSPAVRITDSADGVLKLTNNADSDFNRLQFGGTSSSFPALKRSSTTIQVRLADDSADGGFETGTLRVNQTPTAVSSLTTINSGADSSTNLGHRVSFNLNGTTYWIPCGSVAF